MMQPIFWDLLREQEPNLGSGRADEIIYHTPSPHLSEALSLRFPRVVAAVPPETPADDAPIRWTPELPPWMKVPNGLL